MVRFSRACQSFLLVPSHQGVVMTQKKVGKVIGLANLYCL